MQRKKEQEQCDLQGTAMLKCKECLLSSHLQGTDGGNVTLLRHLHCSQNIFVRENLRNRLNISVRAKVSPLVRAPTT